LSAEYVIPHKHTLKFLCKSKHFPRRYKRKREWVVFLNTVYTQESSAKLTNEHVSDAFTSSPFEIHVCHILHTSKFQHSYFTFFLYQRTAFVKTVSVNTVHWFDASSLRNTPVNKPITLISPVPWVGSIFCRWQFMCSSANFWTVFSESQNASPLDAELGPDFNAKWPFKVIQCHLFRCQWRATKGLHSTI